MLSMLKVGAKKAQFESGVLGLGHLGGLKLPSLAHSIPQRDPRLLHDMPRSLEACFFEPSFYHP